MKARKVFEYMEVHKDKGLGIDRDLEDASFEEIIEVIDRTEGEEFTPGDLRNLIDYLVEIDIAPQLGIKIIQYLAGVHPQIMDDFLGEGPGEYKRLIDGYGEMMADVLRNQGPDPRLN